MDRQLREELYLSLLLPGADEMLLGALEARPGGAGEKDVIADVRNWNARAALRKAA